jgi:hypothetical protein
MEVKDASVSFGGQVHPQAEASVLRLGRQHTSPDRGHNAIVVLVILVAFV